MPRILKDKFYQRDTETVAKELLGKKLVHCIGNQRISGIITETEAYLGLKDKACHTYGGRKTDKTRSMYLHGGHAYVYFIYGKYFCFNVVTLTDQHPEAVLIRALEPLESIDTMKQFRKKDKIKELTTGPGKLCQALGINKSHDGLSLTHSEITIEEHLTITESQIVAKPRIGIHYAQEAKDWPLRFYIKDNLFISKK